jgi:hypothetical protein
VAGSESAGQGQQPAYALPELPESWQTTLDSLRPARGSDEAEWQWRKHPLQPVVFKPLTRLGDDCVHLHLEHPFVQRILSRFRSQGYGAQDLSRVTVIPNDRDGLVRVLCFGRVSLFGDGATRLHDEVISVAARCVDKGGKRELRPFAEKADRQALETLEQLLARPEASLPVSEHVQAQVLKEASDDFAKLWPNVKAEAEECAHRAVQKLKARGEHEARALCTIIEAQRRRIEKAQQLPLRFEGLSPSEKEQQQAERDHLTRRLGEIDRELMTEPADLVGLYRVALERLEPVGLVYLWPTTRL